MKPNNLIALLIVAILFAIGVALGASNYNSQNAQQGASDTEETNDAPVSINTPAASNTEKADTLNQVALIHDDIGAPSFNKRSG